MAKERKVLADLSETKDGQFHVVRFGRYNHETQKLESQGYEVYFGNKPFLKPGRGFGKFSRREARILAKLYNGEARWPS